MRYIAFYFGSVDRPALEKLKDRPGIEIYRVDGPDFQDEIEMALLNDLHCPVKLAFVGGDEADAFAKDYGGVWIADAATVRADLLRFWGLPQDN
jgi:hypothetical protein